MGNAWACTAAGVQRLNVNGDSTSLCMLERVAECMEVPGEEDDVAGAIAARDTMGNECACTTAGDGQYLNVGSSAAVPTPLHQALTCHLLCSAQDAPCKLQRKLSLLL